MKNKNLHSCPYCGEKVPYYKMLLNEKNGEYTCDNCDRYSNIKLKNKSLAWTMVFLFAAVAAILGIITFKETLQGVIFSLIPFLIMYLIIPFFLRLVPITIKRKNNNNENANTIYSNTNQNHTQYFDFDEDVKTYTKKKEKE